MNNWRETRPSINLFLTKRTVSVTKKAFYILRNTPGVIGSEDCSRPRSSYHGNPKKSSSCRLHENNKPVNISLYPLYLNEHPVKYSKPPNFLLLSHPHAWCRYRCHLIRPSGVQPKSEYKSLTILCGVCSMVNDMMRLHSTGRAWIECNSLVTNQLSTRKKRET